MKLLSILFIALFISNSDWDLPELRNLYRSAVKNESKAKELISVTKPFLNNSTYKGYYGAGKIFMAKHYLNPYSKLKTFNEGKEILESAINSDSMNVELRFLRLSIQNNSPTFLGYMKNIEEDKTYLSRCLPSIKDEQLKTIITNYLISI